MQNSSGATVLVSSLSAGDSILAAAADGTLAFDFVWCFRLFHCRFLLLGTLDFDIISSFSLADPSAKAAFLSLTTAAATVTLTPTHQLPAGPAKVLKQASEVAASARRSGSRRRPRERSCRRRSLPRLLLPC